MAVDVKAALLSYRQEPSLTNGDRAHIDRWLAVAKAPVWQKIVADIETTLELPPMVGDAFGLVIARTLRIRKFAETAEYESAAIKKRKQLASIGEIASSRARRVQPAILIAKA
jgi:hypothetical protein